MLIWNQADGEGMASLYQVALIRVRIGDWNPPFLKVGMGDFAKGFFTSSNATWYNLVLHRLKVPLSAMKKKHLG
jgi:hypothetical protein